MKRPRDRNKQVQQEDAPSKKAKLSKVEKIDLDVLPVKEEDLLPWEVPPFVALRQWKRSRGWDLGFNNPCVICHNRTLFEMVRLLPETKEELMAVWGVSPKRYESHGELMLKAIKPWIPKLRAEQKKIRAKQPKLGPKDLKGDGRAHVSWEAERRRSDLPSGPWSKRRIFCATEYGCDACIRHGPNAAWASMSNSLLGRLQQVYGSYENAREAGWRWFANPNHNQGSHNHKWWPPLTTCRMKKVNKVPLGTRKAKKLLEEIVEEQ